MVSHLSCHKFFQVNFRSTLELFFLILAFEARKLHEGEEWNGALVGNVVFMA